MAPLRGVGPHDAKERTMIEKAMPVRVRDLRVPNRDWAYFDDAAACPFRPLAPVPDLANAWRLAEISFLTYVPETDFIRTRVESVGYRRLRVFDSKGSRALLLEAPDHVVVAFRGTDIADHRNLLADADAMLAPFVTRGRVHRGFWAALEAIWPPLKAALTEVGAFRPVYVTGHSLGGAMAVLASQLAPMPVRLYTFGAPRVGDQAFHDAAIGTSARFVHNFDIVTQLPPRVLYRHIGLPIVLRSDGSVENDPGTWIRLKARFANIWGRKLASRRGIKDALGTWMVENALADHAPIGYCVRLWNAARRR